MNKLQILIFSCIAVFVSLFAANQAGAISIRELLGLDEDQQEEAVVESSKGQENAANSENWGKPEGTESEGLELAELKRVLANVDARQRAALLNDGDAFKKFVQQEGSNLSVLNAARANNVDKDANTVFLIRRSSDNILREAYLNKLIASKIPADFPSEQQSKEYFENNREKFIVPERVHVWQVFLQTTADMDEKKIAEVKKQAESISKDIRGGKISFADAAKKYSDHGQSKVSGGYMGLIKVTELKPEIGKPLLGLPEDRTSTPIKTDTGFHVVKRGPKVPPLDVEYEQVAGQIKNLLRNQARTQLRKAIYEQAAKTYPVELTEATIQQWWQNLRSNAQ